MKLSVFELETLASIVGARNNAGFKIKDLRLIESTIGKIKVAVPSPIEQPVYPQPADGKQYTPEEIKANEEISNGYFKAINERSEQEVEIEFNNAEMMIVKQQLSNYAGFRGDDAVRAKVIALGDKFGI